jgi:hypothetical protein
MEKQKVFHNSDLQRQFDRYGYVYTTLLNEAEVIELIDKVNQLKPRDRYAPDIDIYHASDFHCTFLDDDILYKAAMNKLIKEKFADKLDSLLVDYRIINGNFYVKPPKKGFFALHQNWRHTLNDHAISVTIWCPLQDTTIDNGTLHVVPSSHKLTDDISLPNQVPFYRGFEKELWGRHVVEVPVKAGDCLVFCDTLLHGSPTNKSNSTRMAFQIETLPKSEPAVIYHYDEETPHLLEIYEANDDFFLNNDLVNVKMKPTNLPFIGTKPNPNKMITIDDFENQLAQKRAYFTD